LKQTVQNCMRYFMGNFKIYVTSKWNLQNYLNLCFRRHLKTYLFGQTTTTVHPLHLATAGASDSALMQTMCALQMFVLLLLLLLLLLGFRAVVDYNLDFIRYCSKIKI